MRKAGIVDEIYQHSLTTRSGVMKTWKIDQAKIDLLFCEFLHVRDQRDRDEAILNDLEDILRIKSLPFDILSCDSRFLAND